jgi:excinuclease ABC subunit C
MNEVVSRYFRRRLDEKKSLPDLVVIDGGKGQLSAAAAALRDLGLETLQLVSLAKREEEIYVLGRAEAIRLPRRSPGLRMLQQARDEAHRFAVTYNRKRRSMRTVTSELLQVPGIGPSKRRLLLQTFGSVQGVRDATVEQIASLPGFSAASARKLLDTLAHPRGVSDAGPPTTAPASETLTEAVARPASNDDLSPADGAPVAPGSSPSTNTP